MNKITFEQVKEINKKDRIKVTWLNKNNEEISKNTRFYGTEINDVNMKRYILVYVPNKQKQIWEIEEGTECSIVKL